MTAWPADMAALIGFLRSRGLRIGTGEALRAVALLERLAAVGEAPATPDQAARWLAPVLCISPREQAAFPGLLRDFDAVVPAIRIVETVTGTAAPAHIPRGISWTIALGLLAIGGIVGWQYLPDMTMVMPKQLAVIPVPRMWQTVRLGLVWLTGGLTVLPLALVPFVAWLAFIRLRGAERPVLRRRAYEGRSRVAVRTQDGRLVLFGGAAMATIALGLRTHRRVPDTRPDPRASVRATAAAAGRPVLVPGWRPRIPEYPIMVEALSARDHVLMLARALSVRLAEESVFHTTYLFEADPTRLRTEAGVAVSLADVAARYQQDVLIMLGDGNALVDTMHGRLRPWTEDLAGWRHVVLLTPVPRRRWSWRERWIAEGGVIVLPATPDGLALLAEMLRSGGRPPRLAFERSPVRFGLIAREGRNSYRWHSDTQPDAMAREETLEGITQELPRRSFDLLAFAALFPEVRPDLTLYLANALPGLRERPLSEEDFGALAGLPWLRYGRMPDWLRLDLVQTLGAEREAEARRVLADWIDAPVSEAFGAALLIHTGATTPSPAPALPVLHDAIFLRLQRGESLATLELAAPDALRPLARPSWQSPVRLALVAATLVSLVVLVVGMTVSSLVQVFRAIPDNSWVICMLGLVLLSSGAGLGRLWFVTALPRRLSEAITLPAAALGLAAFQGMWVYSSSEWLDLIPMIGLILPGLMLGATDIPAARPQIATVRPLPPTGLTSILAWCLGVLITVIFVGNGETLLFGFIGLLVQAAACPVFLPRASATPYRTAFAWSFTACCGGVMIAALVESAPADLRSVIGADVPIIFVTSATMLLPVGCAVAGFLAGRSSIRPPLLLGLSMLLFQQAILLICAATGGHNVALAVSMAAAYPALLLLLPRAMTRPQTLRRAQPWLSAGALSSAAALVALTVSVLGQTLVLPLTAQPSAVTQASNVILAGPGLARLFQGIGFCAAVGLVPIARALFDSEEGLVHGFRFWTGEVGRLGGELVAIILLLLLGGHFRLGPVWVDLSLLYLPAAFWLGRNRGHAGLAIYLWGAAPLLLPGVDWPVTPATDIGLYLAGLAVFRVAARPITVSRLTMLRQLDLGALVAVVVGACVSLSLPIRWLPFGAELKVDFSQATDLAVVLLGAAGVPVRAVLIGAGLAGLFSAEWSRGALTAVGIDTVRAVVTPLLLYFFGRTWATVAALRLSVGKPSPSTALMTVVTAVAVCGYLSGMARLSVPLVAIALHISTDRSIWRFLGAGGFIVAVFVLGANFDAMLPDLDTEIPAGILGALLLGRHLAAWLRAQDRDMFATCFPPLRIIAWMFKPDSLTHDAPTSSWDGTPDGMT